MKNVSGIIGLSFFTFILLVSCSTRNYDPVIFEEALRNGYLANEGFKRCNNFVNDWLEFADPASGLIPENLTRGIDKWSPKNSAADNYPFMVLTSHFTSPSLFNGKMLSILNKEIDLTSRIASLPDTYSFSKKGFTDDNPDIERIIFGASEYVKDGLMPLTELIGKSPWSERMISLIDDIWMNAPIETKYGLIPSENVEINGEQLQVLSRIYWMTGEEKYLNLAIRLGDYYLLGNNHPTKNFNTLRLRDHGCEIISGLCELYAAVSFSLPKKKDEYMVPIHQMLDRILEVGINKDGMFYNSINPKTGEVIDEGIADTWGYTYNGFYTVYLLDNVEKYRQALLLAFSNLSNYENYNWERGSSDGFADAIESALNLYNREALPNVSGWIEGQTKIMWSLQDSSYRENAQKWKNSGIIEGWHGDGNFARTTIMFCLWKMQGISTVPWQEDLILGAVNNNNTLSVSLMSETGWNGKLIFDVQRFKEIMNMPVDWPRINQFPEWFAIKPNKTYNVFNHQTNDETELGFADLKEGLAIKLNPGEKYFLSIEEL